MSDTIKRFLVSFSFLTLVWMLANDISVLQEWVAGAISAFIITLLFWKHTNVFSAVRFHPKAWIFSGVFVFVFLAALIRSSLDVARRVVRADLPIHPGIVRVKTRLRSPLGRIVLANSITLTPGTLTVETRDDDFFIHWIDVSSDDVEGATKEIVGKFEKYLEVIFG